MEERLAKKMLPIMYCNKLAFIISKLKSCTAIFFSFLMKNDPKNIEAAIIKGINGGKLIWLKMKVRNLLSLNNTDSEIAKTVWNPQNGDIPIKIPSAIDKAFVLSFPSLSNMFSLKNLLKPFLRKYR